ncbi:hypothetical protein SEA_INKED_77 [Arthrobacter phage Inked]|nr:hypothetical protein SEA_INKED_77 [Arthrobacter phage Inked]
MEIVTIECSNLKPHAKHQWREGFLWLRKRTCDGMSQVFYDKRTRKPDPFGNMLMHYCETDVAATSAFYKTIFGVEEEPEPHRHYYGFYPEKSDALVMVWRCLDPFCEEEYSQYRSLFNFQTRTNKSYWLSFWR